MKKIPLTQGKYALVDDEDFEWLNQWKWQTYITKNTYYAITTIRRKNGKRSTVQMHRLILGLVPGNKQETDHCNRKGFDNRKCNLRPCNRAQNMRNKKIMDGSSKYKGVNWSKLHKCWRSRIDTGKKRIHLGLFMSEKKAAKAYDKVALKYFGEFARLNFPGNRKEGTSAVA